MKLVAVIPTYNEAANLAGLIEDLFAQPLGPHELHVLVVDDASPDGTAAVAAAAGERHPGRIEVLGRASKQGLASAYVEGFSCALQRGAEYVAQMDADGSHDAGVLPHMFAAIAGTDLVIGSRYVGGGRDARDGWYRRAGSRLANLGVRRLVPQLPVADPTSGFRLWRRAALQRVDPARRVRSRGYGFQVEMAFLAACAGCRIAEVPIHFHERRTGRSKMTPIVQLRTIAEIAAVPRLHRQAALALRAGRCEPAEPASAADERAIR